MSAIRLFVVVEGDTEEAFVRAVLTPALADRGTWCRPLFAGDPSRAGSKTHGAPEYDVLRKEIIRVLKQQRSNEVRVTTMVDYYRLPSSCLSLAGGDAHLPDAQTPRERVAAIGGNLTVESAPGVGTTLLAEVALDDPKSSV